MPKPIAFDAVPRKFERAGGWTAERQRGFIKALAACGDPERAAQSQGLTGNGAYQLRKAAGAESFRAAWAAAIGQFRGGAAEPGPEAPGPEEARADEEAALRQAELLDRIVATYGRKLAQERAARLAGRIVEADFYCRQLSFIEIALSLGPDAFEMLKRLRRGGHGVLDIAATSMANHLDQVRRAVWRERGEPDRPPPSLAGMPRGEIALPPPTAEANLPGEAAGAGRRRKEAREALLAEAQRQWEEKAKADAETWRAIEEQARAAAGLPPLSEEGTAPIG